MEDLNHEVLRARLQELLARHQRHRESRWPIMFDPAAGGKMLAEVLAMPLDRLHPNTDSLMRAIWDAQRVHNWLLFTGGVGRGKSAAMRVVTCCIQAQARPRLMWTSARDLAASDDRQQSAKSADLLVIDDLGTEPSNVKAYGTDTTPVADVIEARYNTSMPTYITTNLDGEALQQHIGARVVSRLCEMAGIVKFNDFIPNSQRINT